MTAARSWVDPESVRWDFPANEGRLPVVRSLESDLQLFCDDGVDWRRPGAAGLHLGRPRALADPRPGPHPDGAPGVRAGLLPDQRLPGRGALRVEVQSWDRHPVSGSGLPRRTE